MSVLLVGLNHTTASVSLRERLYFCGSTLGEYLDRLCAFKGITEAVILSTCNRTEIVVSGEDAGPIVNYLAERAQISVDELRTHLYIYAGNEAVTHLLRVACGLDSLMIGETQILKQIREAYESARVSGSIGRDLSGLFQQAISAGKRARTETVISQGAFSIGRAGVEFARMLFPNLSSCPVLVLGAGKMSELTARHLASSGVETIMVANRTYAHAVELACRLGGCALHYDQLDEALDAVDILISSTSAPHAVLSAEDIRRVMASRDGRPLCLIDLAMPRDIDPAAGELPNVHLYNIDDLQAVTEADHDKRMAEVPLVETIIAEEAARFAERQAGLETSAVITALRDAFERVRQNELQRAGNVLSSLTPEQQAAVDAMTSAMINKLLHTPTVKLKELLARDPEQQPQAIVCELFDLDGVGEVQV